VALATDDEEDDNDIDGEEEEEEEEEEGEAGEEFERLPGTAATCARSFTRSKGATRVREAAPETAPAKAICQPTFLFFVFSRRSRSAGDGGDGDETGDAIATRCDQASP